MPGVLDVVHLALKHLKRAIRPVAEIDSDIAIKEKIKSINVVSEHLGGDTWLGISNLDVLLNRHFFKASRDISFYRFDVLAHCLREEAVCRW